MMNFLQYIRRRLHNLKHKIALAIKRRELNFTDFSVLSNNCWAGISIYKAYGLRYTTPTVGLFFNDDDYLLFLENLDYYLNCPLEFISPEESRHPIELLLTKRFPIATLGGDVEIYFMHYKSHEEALDKWNKRVKRINRKRLLVKMSIRDNTDAEKKVERFMKLPYKNKICFTPVKVATEDPAVVYVPELYDINLKGDDETPAVNKYVDIPALINSMRKS